LCFFCGRQPTRERIERMSRIKRIKGTLFDFEIGQGKADKILLSGNDDGPWYLVYEGGELRWEVKAEPGMVVEHEHATYPDEVTARGGCRCCYDTGRCQGMAPPEGEDPCGCGSVEDCPTDGYCAALCDESERIKTSERGEV
jgi:hypothetical protein